MVSLSNYSFDNGSNFFELRGKALLSERYTFCGKEPVETDPYIVMRYRALDVQRINEFEQPILVGLRGEEQIPLLNAREMIFDGFPHIAIAKIGAQHFDGLGLILHRRAARATFEILDLYTCGQEELPARFEAKEAVAAGYRAIDLSAYYNSSLPADIGATDGGVLPQGNCGLLGIPFSFGEGMIRPAPGPESNEEIISNFGVAAKRRDCRPESRESTITIPIGGGAKELYFALAIDGEATERCGFRKMQSAILGGTVKKPVLMPLRACDIERFAVRIHYADGRIDECFPASLESGKHILQGRYGLYGVWADGAVESITFENRILDTDISLLALTVNESAERRLPNPFPQTRKVAEKAFDLAPKMELQGDLLILQNGGMELTLDTASGLKICGLKNAYTPAFTVGGALLKVREGERLIETFERKAISIGETARITYRHGDLWITTVFTPDHQDGFILSMEAENKGAEEISCGILFPALNGVQQLNGADSWYFLPKYQNLESNETCFFYEESAPSYPLQFFDLFSPAQGGGLAVCTREREQVVRKYGFQKELGYIDAFIEYPSIYMKVAPGATFRGSSTAFYCHAGDWKAAFTEYKGWLDSWYQPYKCQHRDWYRRLFWLIAEITDYIDKPEISNNPAWYDKETKQHKFLSILKEQAALYGATPDILHLWGWSWSEDYKHMLWGNFGGKDYDAVGGLDAFRAAIKEAEEQTGAKVSLYLHPTLLSEAYPELEQYKHLLVRNEQGNYLGIGNTQKDTFIDDPANVNKVDSFRMCHANEEWRQRVLEMYPRVHAETGVDILYVDEFSLRVDNRCYAEGHGHAVPSNLLKTDRDFISALRERMPEDCVLYGEYYAADVNARYIDCNISYYIVDAVNDMIAQGLRSGDGDDTYCRYLTDAYRFAFPKIVQLILPMAMRYLSWQPLKATFCNAEAIYDSFWDAEESRGRAFMAKSYRTKKKYADCFACDEPRMWIDAPCEALCINEFPGKEGRTAYTLFNRGHQTWFGDVLVVPHQEGATYYDAWNEREADFEIINGMAHIKGAIGAHNVGCIIVVK